MRVTVTGSGGIELVGDRWEPSPDVRPHGHVLLLHGGGQTRHSWSTTGARLSRHGWVTTSMDARGHGESEWAPGPADYQLDVMAEDLRRIVSMIGEPPVVLGACLGGLTALLAAGESPALLRGLVLVDVTPDPDPVGVAKVAAFMRSGLGGFGSLEEAADAIVAYYPQRSRPTNLDGLRKNLRQGGDGRWHWHWDPAFIPIDPIKSIQGVAAERLLRAATAMNLPTLLVHGTTSDVVTPERAMELLDLIPTASLFEVSGAGHMVAGDDNDVFARAIERFLTELTCRSK